jgi:hypothetical protein
LYFGTIQEVVAAVKKRKIEHDLWDHYQWPGPHG